MQRRTQTPDPADILPLVEKSVRRLLLQRHAGIHWCVNSKRQTVLLLLISVNT